MIKNDIWKNNFTKSSLKFDISEDNYKVSEQPELTSNSLRSFYDDLLKDKDKKKEIEPKENDIKESQLNYFCESCNDYFEDRETHVVSSIHLIKLNYESNIYYGIPETNKGYQIMKKYFNWDENKGLGKDKQGRIYPLSTIFKKDRKGLGLVKEKPRITHEDIQIPKVIRQKKKSKEEKKKEKLLRQRKVIEEKRRENELRRIIYKVSDDRLQEYGIIRKVDHII